MLERARHHAHRLATQPTVRRVSRLLPAVLRRRIKQALQGGAHDPAVALLNGIDRALAAADAREARAWAEVRSRADWERFREPRVRALQAALGHVLAADTPPPVRRTATYRDGDCDIACLVFYNQGVPVSANLYLPRIAADGERMPGVLVCHSHHNSKAQPELQVLGRSLARRHCAVLIMDLPGHGERRLHPFDDAGVPGPLGVNRQDRLFRYTLGLQLQLAGGCLARCMVHDLMRGVDLLLQRPDVDPERIALIGSVAGGGDIAAVTAALDPRIAAVVPFNFGAPAEPAAARYFVHGNWESTRALAGSAAGGFAPWLILGAVAPRRLVYAHEFAWNAEADPTWARLRRIYAWYGQPEHLAAVHGSGSVRGHGRADTHCYNVGTVHRRALDRVLSRWLGIAQDEDSGPVRDEAEILPEETLSCLAPRPAASPVPARVQRRIAALGAARVRAARARLTGLDAPARRRQLRESWRRVLGPVPLQAGRVIRQRLGAGVDTLTLADGSVLGLSMLRPSAPLRGLLLGVAQEGARALRRVRSPCCRAALDAGFGVCLLDVRGAGELPPGEEYRGRLSQGTLAASAAQLLGLTALGLRLGDLRSALAWLRAQREWAALPVVLWGDALAPPNAPGAAPAVAFDADPYPRLSEPLGGLLALLCALFEDTVHAVYLRGGLVSLHSLLESPFCYAPYDVVAPGALGTGDLGELVAALAPRPLRMECLVDGRNQIAGAGELARSFAAARDAYAARGVADKLIITPAAAEAPVFADWLDGVVSVRAAAARSAC